jgi:hypothetical protein
MDFHPEQWIGKTIWYEVPKVPRLSSLSLAESMPSEGKSERETGDVPELGGGVL